MRAENLHMFFHIPHWHIKISHNFNWLCLYALDLKSLDGNIMPVRFRPRAPSLFVSFDSAKIDARDFLSDAFTNTNRCFCNKLSRLGRPQCLQLGKTFLHNSYTILVPGKAIELHTNSARERFCLDLRWGYKCR